MNENYYNKYILVKVFWVVKLPANQPFYGLIKVSYDRFLNKRSRFSRFSNETKFFNTKKELKEAINGAVNQLVIEKITAEFKRPYQEVET